MSVAALACVLIALVPLGSILYEVVVRGIGSVGPGFLTGTQPIPCTPGSGVPCAQGGVGNALEGTLILVALSSAIAMPVGLLAGVYLSEYGRGPLGTAVRFFADVMTGLPSIVVGLFVFGLFQIVLPGFVYSTVAGSLALAVIMIPVVARTSEEALRLVPNSVREAGLALGIPKHRVSLRIVASAARDGVLTGALLAVARAGGETAPLLMTAFGSFYFVQGLDKPVAALPLNVYQYGTTAYGNWVALAWGSALVLVLLMLGISVVARLLLHRRFRTRRSPS